MESELYETSDNPQTSEDTNCKRKLKPKESLCILKQRKYGNDVLRPYPLQSPKRLQLIQLNESCNMRI